MQLFIVGYLRKVECWVMLILFTKKSHVEHKRCFSFVFLVGLLKTWTNDKNLD